MHMEQKVLEQKNHELQEQYRNKAKAAHRLDKMYKSLRHQQAAGGLEIAAENEASDSLQVAAGGHGAPRHNRAGSGNSGHSGGRGQTTKFNAWEQQHFRQGPDDRARLQSARESANTRNHASTKN